MRKIVASRISSELDDISNSVEALAKGNPKLAKKMASITRNLDIVANTVDRMAKQEGPAEAYPEGEFGFENEHQDSYTAKNYHKVPVGADSVAKAIGKNLTDIMADLDFVQTTNPAEKHAINVQASLQRAVKNQNWKLAEKLARKAAEIELKIDEDETGSEDDLSTSDLSESGGDDAIDQAQVGGVLPLRGSEPQSTGGQDTGHHARQSSKKYLAAKKILSKIASDTTVQPKVKQPYDLLNSEPGENVERDNSLGGLSGYGRDSSKKVKANTVDVFRPTHVPKELGNVWHEAAQSLANQGKLMTASGKVNYTAINRRYATVLGHLGRVASQINGGAGSNKIIAETDDGDELTLKDFVDYFVNNLPPYIKDGSGPKTVNDIGDFICTVLAPSNDPIADAFTELDQRNAQRIIVQVGKSLGLSR
jgi:hypothetical protein